MIIDVSKLKILSNLNIDELISIKTLLNDGKFDLSSLKRIKKKVQSGKINDIFFNDLYFYISTNYCFDPLKKLINFLIDNYLNIEKIRQIILKLEELKIDIIEIDNLLEYTKNYEVNLKKQKIFTDGIIEYGPFIRNNIYIERIEDSNYIIFINFDDYIKNRIIIKDLVQILDKLPTIEQLENYNPNLKQIEKDTKNINEVFELKEIKQEIISLEKNIYSILKNTQLMSRDEKEELNIELNNLYNLIKEIKKIEISMINKVTSDNMSNEMLVESIKQKQKIKDRGKYYDR